MIEMDVRARKNAEHHAKLDEMITNASEDMHAMIDSAALSGVLSVDAADPGNYLLAKFVLTIWGDTRPYAPLPFDRDNISDMKTLSALI